MGARFSHSNSQPPAGVPVPARTVQAGSNPEPASVWFDPFLDLFPEIAGTQNNAGVVHGQDSNRGVVSCMEKEFPSSEKEFPRVS